MLRKTHPRLSSNQRNLGNGKFDFSSSGRSSSFAYPALRHLNLMNMKKQQGDDADSSFEASMRRATSERTFGQEGIQSTTSKEQNNNNNNYNNNIEIENNNYRHEKVGLRTPARSMPNYFREPSDETVPSNDVEQENFETRQKNFGYRQNLPANYYSKSFVTPSMDGVPGEYMKRSRIHGVGEEKYVDLLGRKGPTGEETYNADPINEMNNDDNQINKVNPVGGFNSPSSLPALELPKLKAFTPNYSQQAHEDENIVEQEDQQYNNSISKSRRAQPQHQHQHLESEMEFPQQNNDNNNDFQMQSKSHQRNFVDPQLELLSHFTSPTIAPTPEQIANLAREISQDIHQNPTSFPQNENSENLQNSVPILRKMRRTARIATSRQSWVGALGLMTALRVAPFVDVNDVTENNNEDNEDNVLPLYQSPAFVEGQRQQNENQGDEGQVRIRSDFVSANYAIALAVAHSALQSKAGRNNNKNNNQNRNQRKLSNDAEEEVIEEDDNQHEQVENSSIEVSADLTPALTIAKTAMMTDLYQQQLESTTNENKNSFIVDQQLQQTSAFCTNYIVSSACQISSQVPSKVDKNQWMIAMSMLQYLNLEIFDSRCDNVERTESEKNENNPFLPPKAIQNAIPFAFAATARTLRQNGQTQQAVHLLDAVYENKIRANFLNVLDNENNDNNNNDVLKQWLSNPSPKHVLARILASNNDVNESNNRKTMRLIQELSGSENNSILELNSGSYLTALSSLKMLCLKNRIASGNEKTSFLSFDDDSESNFSPVPFALEVLMKKCPLDSTEAIESLASILSVRDEAVIGFKLAENLLEFVQEIKKSHENDENDDQDTKFENANESNPYLTLLKKTNHLAHPLVLASLMQTCIRTENYEQAIQLFEQVLPLSSELVQHIPHNLDDRRINQNAVTALAGTLLASTSAVSNSNSMLQNNNNNNSENSNANQEEEEDDDLIQVSEQAIQYRESIIETVENLMRKLRRFNSHRNNHGNNEFLESVARSLSIYAPTLHERGVYECIAAYLAALDASFSENRNDLSTKNILAEPKSAIKKKPSSANGQLILTTFDENNKTTRIIHSNKTLDNNFALRFAQKKQSKIVQEKIDHLLATSLTQSSWRTEFLPQLLQLLYNHGLHNKVSSIYHAINDTIRKFTNASKFDADGGDDDDNGGRRRGGNSVVPLDPASVDFETLKLQDRQQKSQNRRNQTQHRHLQRLEKIRRNSRGGEGNSFRNFRNYDDSSADSLPLVLDARSLCFCAHSLCEIGHVRLAFNIVEDDLLRGQAMMANVTEAQFSQEDEEDDEEKTISLLPASFMRDQHMFNRERCMTGDFSYGSENVSAEVDEAVSRVKKALVNSLVK